MLAAITAIAGIAAAVAASATPKGPSPEWSWEAIASPGPALKDLMESWPDVSLREMLGNTGLIIKEIGDEDAARVMIRMLADGHLERLKPWLEAKPWQFDNYVQAAAQDPAAPLRLLFAISELTDTCDVALSKNSSTPPPLLSKLAKIELPLLSPLFLARREELRAAGAHLISPRDRGTLVYDKVKLPEDFHETLEILIRVAKNPKTPEEDLIRLLRSGHRILGHAVATNPGLPEKHKGELVNQGVMAPPEGWSAAWFYELSPSLPKVEMLLFLKEQLYIADVREELSSNEPLLAHVRSVVDEDFWSNELHGMPIDLIKLSMS